MSLRLPDHVRAFLDDERYATIATTDPDGTPRQAAVWYTLDGDEFVINSASAGAGRRNLLRDPRISLAVIDAADGHRWVGLNGTVRPSRTGPRARPTSQAWPVATTPTTRTDPRSRSPASNRRTASASGSDRRPSTTTSEDA